MLIADEGGGIDGDDAGGTLADGVVVGELLLTAPALFVHDLLLEDGQHGRPAPKGEGADFGKGPKQVEIDVQAVSRSGIKLCKLYYVNRKTEG